MLAAVQLDPDQFSAITNIIWVSSQDQVNVGLSIVGMLWLFIGFVAGACLVSWLNTRKLLVLFLCVVSLQCFADWEPLNWQVQLQNPSTNQAVGVYINVQYRTNDTWVILRDWQFLYASPSSTSSVTDLWFDDYDIRIYSSKSPTYSPATLEVSGIVGYYPAQGEYPPLGTATWVIPYENVNVMPADGRWYLDIDVYIENIGSTRMDVDETFWSVREDGMKDAQVGFYGITPGKSYSLKQGPHMVPSNIVQVGLDYYISETTISGEIESQSKNNINLAADWTMGTGTLYFCAWYSNGVFMPYGTNSGYGVKGPSVVTNAEVGGLSVTNGNVFTNQASISSNDVAGVLEADGLWTTNHLNAWKNSMWQQIDSNRSQISSSRITSVSNSITSAVLTQTNLFYSGASNITQLEIPMVVSQYNGSVFQGGPACTITGYSQTFRFDFSENPTFAFFHTLFKKMMSILLAVSAFFGVKNFFLERGV